MEIETNDQQISGTYYIRIPAPVAKALKLRKKKKTKFTLSFDPYQDQNRICLYKGGD